jgi:phosphinothricin acetyltransferase
MLRHADPDRDGAACAAIYGPFVSGSAASFEADPPDAGEMSARIATYAASHPWLVAERDGQVAGYAYATSHRARAAYRWAVDVSVFIDSDYRRLGVGRALYGALFDLLRRQRILVACAGIALPNDASLGLHESFGFVPVGVYRRIGWKAGAWRDVSWWQLVLSELADGGPPPEPLLPQRLDG